MRQLATPRIIIITLLALFHLSVPPGPFAAPVSFVDDSGAAVTLPEPARRIVPLYSAFNEILAEMGCEGLIIARTAAENSPALNSLPVIGTHMRPNLEQVVGLRPDLVLQMQGRAEAEDSVLALRRLGVPVAVFRVSDFSDLFRLVKTLGVISGREEDAARLENALEQRLAAVNSALERLPQGARPKVFYEVRYPNLLAAGPGSISDAIIRAAGGENYFSPEDEAGNDKILRVSEERLLLRNPDVYVIQRGPMNKNPVPLEKRPNFAGLEALRKGRILAVDEERFARPGPRNIQAVEELARFLHPDLFPDKAD